MGLPVFFCFARFPQYSPLPTRINHSSKIVIFGAGRLGQALPYDVVRRRRRRGPSTHRGASSGGFRRVPLVSGGLLAATPSSDGSRPPKSHPRPLSDGPRGAPEASRGGQDAVGGSLERPGGQPGKTVYCRRCSAFRSLSLSLSLSPGVGRTGGSTGLGAADKGDLRREISHGGTLTN